MQSVLLGDQEEGFDDWGVDGVFLQSMVTKITGVTLLIIPSLKLMHEEGEDRLRGKGLLYEPDETLGCNGGDVQDAWYQYADLALLYSRPRCSAPRNLVGIAKVNRAYKLEADVFLD
jgi:hypothetical protein